MGDLNRRDALRLALGMGDRIALEREQQSALEVMRDPSTPPPPAPAPEIPKRSRLGAFGARLKARLFGRTTEPEA